MVNFFAAVLFPQPWQVYTGVNSYKKLQRSSMLKGEGVCGSLDNSIIPKLKHTLLKHTLQGAQIWQE
jgi:hypothetical protein